MNQKLSDECYKFTIQVFNQLHKVEFAVAVISFFLNLPHLCILFQKTMRVSSTNAMIAGIAMCDLVTAGTVISEKSLTWIVESSSCINPNAYLYQLTIFVINALGKTTVRISFWLAILLVLVRLLALRTKTKISYLGKSTKGLWICLFTYITCFALSGNMYGRMVLSEMSNSTWSPPTECSKSYNQPKYIVKFPEQTARIHLDIYKGFVAFSQAVSSVIYPFLAFVLYIQVRRSAKMISLTNYAIGLERHRITRMILCVTLSYVISSVPRSIIWITLETVNITTNSFLEILTNYGFCITSIFFSINASSQCVICFFLSSKYRHTAKMLLMIRPTNVK